MSSAYPVPVDTLTDRVRDHARQVGELPSLRQVMNQFRVGRPKAAAALDALRTAGFDPATGHTTTAPAADPVIDLDLDPPTVPIPVVRVPDAAPDHAADTVSMPDVTVVAEVRPVADTPTLTPVFSPVSAAADAVVTVEVLPRRWGAWPLVLIALGAFVSIWGGWVGLGELTGFGPIRLLPGIADQVVVNSAITLPIGVEAYAAFALRAWLAPMGLSDTARGFARASAIGALTLGAAGQIAYHLMVAAGITAAPWPITAFVSCLPVVVLGCGAALTHLVHHTPTNAHRSTSHGEETR